METEDSPMPPRRASFAQPFAGQVPLTIYFEELIFDRPNPWLRPTLIPMKHQSTSAPSGSSTFTASFSLRASGALLALLAFAPPTASANGGATLNIDREITGIVHHFTPPSSGFPNLPGYVIDEIQFEPTGLTGVNLSQFANFKLRLFAAPGKKVVINRAGTFESGISLFYRAGNDSSTRTEPATLWFDDFSGTMPTRDLGQFYIGDSGNRLNFQADEIYSGAVEFTAMSYSFAAAYNPANTAKNFVRDSSVSIPMYFGYETNATTDPGPLVSIVTDIPSPVLVIDRQITGLVHHFIPPNVQYLGSPGLVKDEILFDSTGLTGVDLSQFASFKLRLSAAAGKKLVVNRSGSYQSGVSVYYRSGFDSSAHTESGKLTYEQYAGLMPTRDDSLFFVGDSGNYLHFQADETYSGAAEFTAMSYAFPANYNPFNTAKNFSRQSFRSIPVHFSYQTSATTDPGPFVTLAPLVPLMPTISGESGLFSVSWLTKANQHYQLKATTNLTDPGSWLDLGNRVIGNGGPYTANDVPGEIPAKFYRVHILPQSSP